MASWARSFRGISAEAIAKLSNEALRDLLFSEADRVPRAVADEIIKRGNDMVPLLSAVLNDERNWERAGGGEWSIIHATYLLGAIGGERAVGPLITGLQRASTDDVDLILEELPSIFGKIGPVALDPLRALASSPEREWIETATALQGMAAITLRHACDARSIFDFIASFVKDEHEDRDIRGAAGGILLDFCEDRYRKRLLQFAEEDARSSADAEYIAFFSGDDVRRILDTAERRTELYTRDWLTFYSDTEIAARQERWRQELSRWRWAKRLSRLRLLIVWSWLTTAWLQVRIWWKDRRIAWKEQKIRRLRTAIARGPRPP